MATYTIEPERRTLHGTFSRELPPVLTIDSEDTVIYRTLDAGWNLEPRLTPEGTQKKFEPRDPATDSGHALCGPVAIRGAQPGMTLEVQINAIRPGAWGGTYVGGPYREINRRLGVVDHEEALLWTLDPDALMGRDQYGHTLPLRPFT